MIRHQYSLELIEHKHQTSIIQQRASDGYINATDLCGAAGRRWYNYVRTEETGKFLRALAESEGVATSVLTDEVVDRLGVKSTWVHPKVAIHLAQWLSAEFAVAVSGWIYDWLSGKGTPKPASEAVMPYHLRRHMTNLQRVPHTHFSILQEMTNTLIGPLEAAGYTLPESMVPDISQGQMFCRFLREKHGLDTTALPTYIHRYPDGREFEAKLYPVEVLAAFRHYVAEVWMPERAEKYFKERDPQALPYLDKVLRLTCSTTSPTPPRRRNAVVKKAA